ncbi:protein FAM169B isoform X2 [Fukomys damarensis]|uniref:protein FAM169B isoform X2 n=1 Tax=Fukomys damarensis TaxID=885580 RepID=UPI00145583D7|nr:protein FAM169B isoform X2 [Fukomys damarensis]
MKTAASPGALERVGRRHPAVQVKLETSSVCFCTVYRDEPQHKILVLVNPRGTKTVVAVYLKESWWSLEDVLRTSDPAREGLRKEQAKILWKNGAAVGFYTVKLKGSLCSKSTGACYLLPVFDTVFVRRAHRRQGLGTAMLRDFCDTFPRDEALGVSSPISPAMFQVCRHFLLACPEQRGRLWEVKAPGTLDQRINIWLQIQLQQEHCLGEEVENKNDQECGAKEEEAGLPVRLLT